MGTEAHLSARIREERMEFADFPPAAPLHEFQLNCGTFGAVRGIAVPD